ncbi:MAG: DUF4446 family protein [Patescibacteria group bacterium]
MEFTQSSMVLSILILLSVWVGALTVLVLRMIGHYNRLTKGVSAIGLKSVLDEILDVQMGLKKQGNALTLELGKLAADGQLHIQRIGIVRFNPFADTGGAQSFTMSLLDGQDNGIVITSLYARTGNRWYVKEVQKGTGKDIELSREEQAAIKKAV